MARQLTIAEAIEGRYPPEGILLWRRPTVYAGMSQDTSPLWAQNELQRHLAEERKIANTYDIEATGRTQDFPKDGVDPIRHMETKVVHQHGPNCKHLEEEQEHQQLHYVDFRPELPKVEDDNYAKAQKAAIPAVAPLDQRLGRDVNDQAAQDRKQLLIKMRAAKAKVARK
jgi:hypothetical protein